MKYYLWTISVLAAPFTEFAPEPFKEQGVLALAPAVINLSEAFSTLRFDSRQQCTRPMFLVFIMLFEHAAGFHGECRDRVAYKETGAFIETNDRKTSIKRQ